MGALNLCLPNELQSNVVLNVGCMALSIPVPLFLVVLPSKVKDEPWSVQLHCALQNLIDMYFVSQMN